MKTPIKSPTNHRVNISNIITISNYIIHFLHLYNYINCLTFVKLILIRSPSHESVKPPVNITINERYISLLAVNFSLTIIHAAQIAYDHTVIFNAITELTYLYFYLYIPALAACECYLVYIY